MRQIILLLFLTLPQVSFAKYQYGWGTKVTDGKNGLKIGGRIQAIAESNNNEDQDFYLRRLRVNLTYVPFEGHRFVYDVRNDSANEDDKGEKDFNIGDAYWQIKLSKWGLKNIRLFRAKVDVSYSQTSSSRNLFNPQRAEISEHASDFVVHNRRATNAQANGLVGNMTYHLVVSDGVQSEDLEDLSGNEVGEVSKQKFTYGGKIRYYFFGDPNKAPIQDTFYGNHDTFSLGLGYFANDRITVTNSAGGPSEFFFGRNLTNVDVSFALGGWRLLGEYFQLNGDLIDLSASSKNDIIGSSSGYYVQLEKTFGKWAPYIGYELFDRNQGIDDSNLTVSMVGINYYELMDAMRFGFAVKSFRYEDALNSDDQDQAYAYFMVNF